MVVGRLIWSEEFLIWGGKGGIEGWGCCSSFLTGEKRCCPSVGVRGCAGGPCALFWGCCRASAAPCFVPNPFNFIVLGQASECSHSCQPCLFVFKEEDGNGQLKGCFRAGRLLDSVPVP